MYTQNPKIANMILIKTHGINLIVFNFLLFALWACSNENKVKSNRILSFQDSAYKNYKTAEFKKASFFYDSFINVKQATRLDLYYAAHTAAFNHEYRKCIKYLTVMIDTYKYDNTEFLVSRIINQEWDYYNELSKTKGFGKISAYVNSNNCINKNFDSIVLLLNKLFQQDQMIRIKYASYHNEENSIKLNEITRYNDSCIISLIGKYGWLSFNKIGYKGYQSFFTILLHSSASILISYFDLVRRKYRQHEILKKDYAYYIDKYCIYKKLPQIYGSQYLYDSSSNHYIFYPIKNVKRINVLRKEMNLISIEEYAAENNILLH